jgi:hypothetical protein
MSDTTSIRMAQRAFWSSEATRRWATEQVLIDRLYNVSAPTVSRIIAAHRSGPT